ncbi:hypothetical protein OsJ_20864 [Oryza sativa Japonica Group]|uniref:Uncharacterized protein n=1 Tax=Oryza sativa subsp. japonica TaxID=39947 RepID=B9FSL2_ORYSJ|nr:hypothetical protein OsJ_20864 [Oryza sativa Japonica Group]
MDLDADMIPSSPSADYSSPSSSDLDTESTGSFFPDRSTTLGTLMGVSAFGGGGQRRAARTPARTERERAPLAARPAGEEEEGRPPGGWRRRRRRRQRRGSRSLGGSLWRLCRDDAGGPPTFPGGVPRHGEAARRRGLPLRRRRRRRLGAGGCGCGCSVGGRVGHRAVRGREGAPTAAAATRRRRAWAVASAESDGGLLLLLLGLLGASSSLARLPVLLTGICSGGAG